MKVQEGKYLTFSLGREEYGIPIQKIKEIIGMMEITHIPKTPGYIKGVINLRGKIIPLMDLRLKLEMEEVQYTERTCIIVADIHHEDVKRQMGLAVDSVSEVVNLQSSEIEPPAEYGQVSDDFMAGIGKVKGKVILLMDIERVISNEELELLKEFK